MYSLVKELVKCEKQNSQIIKKKAELRRDTRMFEYVQTRLSFALAMVEELGGDVGLKLIGKLADFFLTLSVEGKLIIYFINFSLFHKQLHLFIHVPAHRK